METRELPLAFLEYLHHKDYILRRTHISNLRLIAGSLESAYSLIWGSHKIWGKGGGDTLDLLW